MYTIGMEEEYFVFDATTRRAVRRSDKKFLALAQKQLGKGRELWLVDAINKLVHRGYRAYYKKIEHGRWYTTGDPVNYLEAVRAFALESADYKNKVRHIFTTKH